MPMKYLISLVMGILVASMLLAGCTQENGTPLYGVGGPSSNVQPFSSLRDLEAIHLNLSASDIPRIGATVADPRVNRDIRDRAIFILTDVALSTNRTGEALTLLKRVAATERDERLRTAAYANIDLIRRVSVADKYGDVEIRIDGLIHQGTNVTLVAKISTYKPISKTLFGITKIVEGEKGPTDGIVIINPPLWPIHVSLQPGSSQEIPITLTLAREGEYQIVCALQMDVDRTDYQRIQKEVYITVRKDSGEYEVVETPQSFSF